MNLDDYAVGWHQPSGAYVACNRGVPCWVGSGPTPEEAIADVQRMEEMNDQHTDTN